MPPTSPSDIGGGQRGLGRTQPVAPNTNFPNLTDYLPSGRTVLQAGGATVGGVLGSAGGPLGTIGGGALGAGTGESLYQAVQRFRGRGYAPQSSLEAAKEIGGAGAGGALQEAVGVALPAAGRAISSRLYRIALKPSTALTTEEAAEVANTLLKNRIGISDKGVRTLNAKIGTLNQQVDAEIASNPSAELSPLAVAKRVDPTIQDFAYKDLQGDAAAAAGEKTRFINEHSTPVQYSPLTAGGNVPPVQTYRMENPIPAVRGQAMKKAIYQELSPNDFGTVAEGYKQGRKQIARGLKEEIEAMFPRVEGLNAAEGKLLEARPELNRAVNRTANRDVIGIGAPLAAGAMNVLTDDRKAAVLAALAKSTGARTAIIGDILSNPVGPVTPAALPRFGVLAALRRLTAQPNQ
jgi:hypothetical protein